MAEQKQEQKQKVSQKDADQLAEQDAQRVYESEKDRLARIKAKGEDLKEDIDDLLDEIDGLLEEQDVLVNFRQKGGQAVRVFIGTVLRGFESMFSRRSMRVL